MKSTTMRARLLASSMICSAAVIGLAGPAAAQQADDAVEEVVVTGTRIPQPNLTSTSPLSVVGSQEVKLQGATSIETVLQNLPAVVPEFNQGVGNGSIGTATVGLRGLGSKRTLVLVNGNRLMPGDPIFPSPDLNNIPAALVERVDVVTGGASAVYGSDAVAGVVNFIMTKDFEGIRLDATYGGAIHRNNNDYLRGLVRDYNATAVPAAQIPLASNDFDAQSYDVTLVMGVNAPDGRGNITAYASYRKIKPLSQGDRDYGACGVSTLPSTSDVYDTQVCQGSGNTAFGRFLDFGLANNPNLSNTFVPYTGALAFNFGPFNYYQQEDERYTAGFFARYELSEMAEVYSDLMFADDSQRAQAAPSGLFFNNGPVHSINCANPLMSAAQAAIICGPDATVVNGVSTNLSIAYRLAAVPRLTRLDHQAFTIGTGVRGRIMEDWNYDLRAQYGKTNYRQIFTGDVSIRKINDALNAVAGPDGTPVCVSGNAGCVPLNIFRALSAGITQDQVDYILDPGFQNGETIEQIVSFNVNGKLPGIKSPWAEDGVGVAFGAEYRREQLDLQVSSNFGSADLSGSGGVSPPATGEFDVYELYGEARIPLVSDAPFMQSLTAELGYRFADYSVSGTASAYKISGDWEINDDVRVRGGFNRAVRAPNIVEFFAPQVVGLASFDDPCSGAAPAANCARTFANAALAAAQLGRVPDCAAAQCSQLGGGNPDLTPEKADTITVGVVFTPNFLPGFNASVDWYSIKIKEPIVAGIGGALVLSQCIQNNQFCEFVHRDPDTGALFGLTLDDGYVINTNVNSGSIKTEGFDVTANYRREIGDWGTVALQMFGTFTDKFITEPVSGLGKYECAAIYGLVCGQPVPEWKHAARLTWTTPWNGIAISGNWRHVGPVKLDLNTDDPFLAAFGVGFEDSADARIKAYNYFDVAVNWKVNDISLRAGMNNIFDKDPPVVDANAIGIAGTFAFGNGNTFPGVYDTLGRTVFVGITADF